MRTTGRMTINEALSVAHRQEPVDLYHEGRRIRYSRILMVGISFQDPKNESPVVILQDQNGRSVVQARLQDVRVAEGGGTDDA